MNTSMKDGYDSDLDLSLRNLYKFDLELDSGGTLNVVVLESLKDWIKQNSEEELLNLIQKALNAFIRVTGKKISKKEGACAKISSSGEPNISFCCELRKEGDLDKLYTVKLDVRDKARAISYLHNGEVVSRSL